MTSNREGWIDCTVSPGQFSVEYAVCGTLYNGGGFSLFAPREDVECEGTPSWDEPLTGRLRVKLLQEKDEKQLVRLPREALENGYVVTVKTDQVHRKTSV